MSVKSNKKERHVFDDEDNRKIPEYRQSKVYKYQSEKEEEYDFDEGFEWADEVRHILKK